MLLCVAAVAMAFGVSAYLALEEQRQFADLRAKYPYESMEERLPAHHPAFQGEITRQTAERLDRLEESIRVRSGFWPDYFRDRSLQKIHEDQVKLFINSPGFGVAHDSS